MQVTKTKGKLTAKLFKREERQVADVLDLLRFLAHAGPHEIRADAKGAAEAVEKFTGHFKQEAAT